MITSGSADCRRVSPLWPFCPPGFLPEDPRRLDTRAGFFNPSLDGGLPLLELFRPSRRSSSATRATSAAMCDACASISVISYSRGGASTSSATIRFLNRKAIPASRKIRSKINASEKNLGSYLY